MSYFQAVRLYSLVEVCIFTGLIVTAVGGFSEQAETVLGWTHGFGWIFLCLLVARGCAKGVFPWWLLGASVSPLGAGGGLAQGRLSRGAARPQRLAARAGGEHGRARISRPPRPQPALNFT